MPSSRASAKTGFPLKRWIAYATVLLFMSCSQLVLGHLQLYVNAADSHVEILLLCSCGH